MRYLLLAVVIALLLQLAAFAINERQVQLSWTPPVPIPGIKVKAYRVFRKQLPSGLWKQIKGGIATPAYLDTGVYAGRSYAYYVVSVDTLNRVSDPSNTFQISVQ